MKKDKSQIHNLIKDHPFHSDYSVITSVFQIARDKYEKDFFTIVGNCTSSSDNFEIINFKLRQIEKVEERILKIYYDHLVELKRKNPKKQKKKK